MIVKITILLYISNFYYIYIYIHMSNYNNDMKEYINRINTHFNNDYNDETFNELVMDIDLDDQNKKLFIRRITEILIKNGKKCKMYNTVLNTLRYILQIFSAVLTFTLSINSLTTISFLNYINLAILFILTLTTNIYFQSKLGEKYITIKKSYNKVVKEMWAYISLSGSYSGKSHQENLNTFFNNIDKIIEQENNTVINIDREIDRSISTGSGSGSGNNNNIPKMKLGSKNDNDGDSSKDAKSDKGDGGGNNSIPLNNSIGDKYKEESENTEDVVDGSKGGGGGGGGVDGSKGGGGGCGGGSDYTIVTIPMEPIDHDDFIDSNKKGVFT